MMKCPKCGKQAFLIDIKRHVSGEKYPAWSKKYGCAHCGWSQPEGS